MKMCIIAAGAFAIVSPAIAQQAKMPPMDQSKMPMEQSDMIAMMNDPANPYGASEMDMHKK